MIDDIKRPKPSLREIFPKKINAKNPPPVDNYRLVSAPRPSRRSFFVWFAVIVVIAAAGFSLFGWPVRATIKVVPEQTSLALNETITAYLKPSATSSLSFKLMTIEESASKMVKATGTKKVEKRASGRIIVYNKHSASPQKLIAQTRFESPQGLIYRIAEPITVPGYTKTTGEIKPGAVEVTVTADAPGNQYNIGLADWVIPAFRGDPRFKSFYAKSKTPMTGGLVGEVRVVDVKEEAAVREELKTALREQLATRAKTEVPADFIMFSAASQIEFISEEPLAAPDGLASETVELKERAKFVGAIFDKSELGRFLAGRKAEKAFGDYDIVNLNDLNFSLAAGRLPPTADSEDLVFVLQGEAKLVANFDKQKLLKQLLGLKKDEHKEVFLSYPAIKEASVILRPPWAKHFPKTIDQIMLEVVLQ